LRSRESYYYYQQSLQNNQIIAYHRHAPATSTADDEFVMVFLNFSDTPGSVTIPFPKAGTWKEMIDADVVLTVQADGANQPIVVPSNYGLAFVWPT